MTRKHQDVSKRTRRADGKPEAAADKRFFDLRESGYTGPIDQDGRKATDPETLSVLADLGRTSRRR